MVTRTDFAVGPGSYNSHLNIKKGPSATISKDLITQDPEFDYIRSGYCIVKNPKRRPLSASKASTYSPESTNDTEIQRRATNQSASHKARRHSARLQPRRSLTDVEKENYEDPWDLLDEGLDFKYAQRNHTGLEFTFHNRKSNQFTQSFDARGVLQNVPRANPKQKSLNKSVNLDKASTNNTKKKCLSSTAKKSGSNNTTKNSRDARSYSSAPRPRSQSKDDQYRESLMQHKARVVGTNNYPGKVTQVRVQDEFKLRPEMKKEIQSIARQYYGLDISKRRQ